MWRHYQSAGEMPFTASYYRPVILNIIMWPSTIIPWINETINIQGRLFKIMRKPTSTMYLSYLPAESKRASPVWQQVSITFTAGSTLSSFIDYCKCRWHNTVFVVDVHKYLWIEWLALFISNIQYKTLNFMSCCSTFPGHLHVAEILLKKGADVNATDYHGSSPLHLACQKGHQKLVVSTVLILFHTNFWRVATWKRNFFHVGTTFIKLNKNKTNEKTHLQCKHSTRITFHVMTLQKFGWSEW